MRTAVLFSLAAATSLAGCVQSSDNVEPKTEEDRTLYSMGVLLGTNLLPFELTDKEMAMVKAGLQDAARDKAKIPQEEIDAVLPRIQALGDERQAVAVEKQKKAGAEQLEKAAAEPGAIRTESGMVFRSITEGTGNAPTETDIVVVHYEGRLVNGKVFDSSIERNEPAEFPLAGVIPCWTEGVQLMKVGGKAKLTCPPELAYGDMGRPPRMPGGATLTFDVELLDIVGAPEGAPAQ
jgi:FKBP-type peptidyl-prolyl cis-trans isomerase FkpA